MKERGALALVFAASGAVLVLEIMAGRLLAPYVGVSLETYTGVIGCCLAGIAVGAAAGGRLADARDPRRLLGPTVTLGGILAVLSISIVRVLGPGVEGDGPAAIVVLAAAGFFAPAAVLSAVTPMVAKLRLDDLERTGTTVGALSAAGTAGALVGTFATGFLLVAALPSTPIVLGLGAALVVTGLVLWWRLSPDRPGGAVPLAALVAGGLAALVPTPCQHETAYFCASVEIDPARPSGRLLLLDSLRHSYVDLEDPTHLEFRYERLFAAAVPDGPVDALHVGGGGFTFPRYLLATAPGSTNRVLELDPELVRLAQEELGLVTGPDLTVRTGDARTALEEEPTDAYDVVVVDAFGGLAPPWHLTTREVVEQEARALRAGGVLVANVIDGGAERFARAEAATLQAVFDEVAVILPPPGRSGARSNIVLVASDRPLVLRPVAPADGTAVTGAAVDRWVDGARILTDDFAPVDQLVARR